MRIKLNEGQIKNLLSSYKNSLNEQFTKNSEQGFNPQTKQQTINFGSVWLHQVSGS